MMVVLVYLYPCPALGRIEVAGKEATLPRGSSGAGTRPRACSGQSGGRPTLVYCVRGTLGFAIPMGAGHYGQVSPPRGKCPAVTVLSVLQ